MTTLSEMKKRRKSDMDGLTKLSENIEKRRRTMDVISSTTPLKSKALATSTPSKQVLLGSTAASQYFFSDLKTPKSASKRKKIDKENDEKMASRIVNDMNTSMTSTDSAQSSSAFSEDSDLMNKSVLSDTTELTASTFVLTSNARQRLRESYSSSQQVEHKSNYTPAKARSPFKEITGNQAPDSMTKDNFTPIGNKQNQDQSKAPSASIPTRFSSSPNSLRKLTDSLRKARRKSEAERNQRLSIGLPLPLKKVKLTNLPNTEQDSGKRRLSSSSGSSVSHWDSTSTPSNHTASSSPSIDVSRSSLDDLFQGLLQPNAEAKRESVSSDVSLLVSPENSDASLSSSGPQDVPTSSEKSLASIASPQSTPKLSPNSHQSITSTVSTRAADEAPFSLTPKKHSVQLAPTGLEPSPRRILNPQLTDSPARHTRSAEKRKSLLKTTPEKPVLDFMSRILKQDSKLSPIPTSTSSKSIVEENTPANQNVGPSQNGASPLSPSRLASTEAPFSITRSNHKKLTPTNLRHSARRIVNPQAIDSPSRRTRSAERLSKANESIQKAKQEESYTILKQNEEIDSGSVVQRKTDKSSHASTMFASPPAQHHKPVSSLDSPNVLDSSNEMSLPTSNSKVYTERLGHQMSPTDVGRPKSRFSEHGDQSMSLTSDNFVSSPKPYSSKPLSFSPSINPTPPASVKAKPPKSILGSSKKRNPLESSQKKSVAFGSPEAAEYRIGSPSKSLTPMPSIQAKAMFTIPSGSESDTEGSGRSSLSMIQSDEENTMELEHDLNEVLESMYKGDPNMSDDSIATGGIKNLESSLSMSSRMSEGSVPSADAVSQTGSPKGNVESKSREVQGPVQTEKGTLQVDTPSSFSSDDQQSSLGSTKSKNSEEGGLADAEDSDMSRSTEASLSFSSASANLSVSEGDTEEIRAGMKELLGDALGVLQGENMASPKTSSLGSSSDKSSLMDSMEEEEEESIKDMNDATVQLEPNLADLLQSTLTQCSQEDDGENESTSQGLSHCSADDDSTSTAVTQKSHFSEIKERTEEKNTRQSSDFADQLSLQEAHPDDDPVAADLSGVNDSRDSLSESQEESFRTSPGADVTVALESNVNDFLQSTLSYAASSAKNLHESSSDQTLNQDDNMAGIESQPDQPSTTPPSKPAAEDTSLPNIDTDKSSDALVIVESDSDNSRGKTILPPSASTRRASMDSNMSISSRTEASSLTSRNSVQTKGAFKDHIHNDSRLTPSPQSEASPTKSDPGKMSESFDEDNTVELETDIATLLAVASQGSDGGRETLPTINLVDKFQKMQSSLAPRTGRMSFGVTDQSQIQSSIHDETGSSDDMQSSIFKSPQEKTGREVSREKFDISFLDSPAISRERESRNSLTLVQRGRLSLSTTGSLMSENTDDFHDESPHSSLNSTSPPFNLDTQEQEPEEEQKVEEDRIAITLDELYRWQESLQDSTEGESGNFLEVLMAEERAKNPLVRESIDGFTEGLRAEVEDKSSPIPSTEHFFDFLDKNTKEDLLAWMPTQIAEGSADSLYNQAQSVVEFGLTTWECMAAESLIAAINAIYNELETEGEQVESQESIQGEAKAMIISISDERALQRTRQQSLERLKVESDLLENQISLRREEYAKMKVDVSNGDAHQGKVQAMLSECQSRIRASEELESEKSLAHHHQGQFISLKGSTNIFPKIIRGSTLSLLFQGRAFSLGLNFFTLENEVKCSATVEAQPQTELKQGSFLLSKCAKTFIKMNLGRAAQRLNALKLGATPDLPYIANQVNFATGRMESTAVELTRLEKVNEMKILNTEIGQSKVLILQVTFKKSNDRTQLLANFEIDSSYPFGPLRVTLSPEETVGELKRVLARNAKPGFGYLSRCCDVIKAHLR